MGKWISILRGAYKNQLSLFGYEQITQKNDYVSLKDESNYMKSKFLPCRFSGGKGRGGGGQWS
jgi:hypothetical protein